MAHAWEQCRAGLVIHAEEGVSKVWLPDPEEIREAEARLSELMDSETRERLLESAEKSREVTLGELPPLDSEE